MIYRLSFGALAISVLLLVVAADAWIADEWQIVGPTLGRLLRRGSLIPLVFTGLMVAGAAELIRLMRAAHLRPHARWGVLTVAGLMLSPWLCAGRVLPGSPLAVEGQVVWLAAAALGALVLELRRGPQPDAIQNIGATLLITLYCGFLPSFIILLRCSDGLPIPQGAWLVLLFLAVTKASDIGAFFTGLAAGRHKLMPSVSPGKTVEGAVGGVAASVAAGVFLWHFSKTVGGIDAVPSTNQGHQLAHMIGEGVEILSGLSLLQVLIFSVVMSVFGQAGDLAESLLKRTVSAKDSARLVPTFGGVLDVADSPIAAGPAAWFLLTYVWGVV